jgi:hypothetical protein
MNVTAISHIEHGRANPARGTVLQRIAAALGLTVSEVAARADQLADADQDVAARANTGAAPHAHSAGSATARASWALASASRTRRSA